MAIVDNYAPLENACEIYSFAPSFICLQFTSGTGVCGYDFRAFNRFIHEEYVLMPDSKPFVSVIRFECSTTGRKTNPSKNSNFSVVVATTVVAHLAQICDVFTDVHSVSPVPAFYLSPAFYGYRKCEQFATGSLVSHELCWQVKNQNLLGYDFFSTSFLWIAEFIAQMFHKLYWNLNGFLAFGCHIQKIYSFTCSFHVLSFV